MLQCATHYLQTCIRPPPSVTVSSVINDWIPQKLRAVTSGSDRGLVFACWQPPAGVHSGARWLRACLSHHAPCETGNGTLTHTGNGSAPSWMTKPSITCVRTWGFTMACGGLFSPFCGVLPVTVGASLVFPEVMAGGGVSGEALGLLVGAPPEQ